jgi:hypothetical protein
MPENPYGGFPQHGFKAGMSDSAFPSTTWCLRRMVCIPPSCTRDLYRCILALSRGTPGAGAPPFKRLLPLCPRDPRSGPGYVVPVHHHLTGPMRPTPRHSAISLPSGLYALPSLCALFPRLGDPGVDPRFVSILSRHVVLRDYGKFIGCLHPVPSPTTPAFDQNACGLGASKDPPPSDSRGEEIFGASLRFAFAATCRFACPPRRS